MCGAGIYYYLSAESSLLILDRFAPVRLGCRFIFPTLYYSVLLASGPCQGCTKSSSKEWMAFPCMAGNNPLDIEHHLFW